MQPGDGAPGVGPQPGMPAHAAAALPHAMHAPWLHVGAGSSCAIVRTVLMPIGKGRTMPSAVANGVVEQRAVVPSCPPQSDSLLHGPKRFVGAFVWQSFGPPTLS